MKTERFKIVRKIPKEGTFAKVYEAYDNKFEIRVAIKELKSEHHNNPEIVERFYKEAQKIFNWNHPNIVQIIDLNREKHYFALSYFPETLDDRLHTFQGTLSLGRTIRLAIDIAKALVEMEDRSVVHCDIKPANIMFDEKGNAILTDFGIAVDLNQQLPGVWGTPPYMSPEQERNEALDSRSDQYAFGILLYEVATGTLPHSDPNVDQVNALPLEKQAMKIRFVDGALPLKMEQIITKLTQSHKEDRYPSATVLLNSLNELKREFRQKILENAEIYYKNGNLDLAIAELTNYLQDVDPESFTVKKKLGLYQFRAALNHARLELQKGDLVTARQFLPEKQKEEINDQQLADEFTQLESDISRAETATAKIAECLRRKDFDGARESLQYIIQIESENASLSQQDKAIQTLVDGILSYENYNYSSAFQKLTTAQEQYPFDLDYLVETIKAVTKKLGDEEILFKKQDELLVKFQDQLPFTEAKTLLHKLTTGDLIYDQSNRKMLHQVYGQINFQIAQKFWQDKQFRKAQEYLDNACGFQPENKQYKQRRLELFAQIYVEQENYDSAKQIYQKLTDGYDESFFDKVSEMTIKANIQNEFFKIMACFRQKDKQKELTRVQTTLAVIERLLQQNLISYPQYDYSTFTQRFEIFKKIARIAESMVQNEKDAIQELYSLRESLNPQQAGNNSAYESIEALIANVSEQHRQPPPTKPFEKSGVASKKPKSRFRSSYILVTSAAIILFAFLIFIAIKSGIFHRPSLPPPSPTKSVLLIRQIPERAVLQLNDKDYSFRNGVFVDFLTPGEYRIRIRQPNYYDFNKTIQLLATQNDTVTVAMIPLPPPESSGLLSLYIQPPPDLVLIDQMPLPANGDNYIKVLAVGNHSLVVTKNSYGTVQQVIQILPGQNVVLNLNLVALAPGSLLIQVQPYATIYLDDSIVAENSANITLASLPAGAHQVTFTHPGYLGSFSQDISIASNIQTTLQKNLLKECGTLIIQINIMEGGQLRTIWANILLNNQDTGMAVDYLNTKIFAGQYELDVQRAGYLNRTGRQLISIQRGQQINCNFELAIE